MTDTNPPAADRVAEIRARLDGADTPGPWEIEPDEHGTRLGSKTRWVGHCPDCDTTAEFGSGDADLIAHAPADLAYLLSRVGELETQLGAKQRELDLTVNQMHAANASALRELQADERAEDLQRQLTTVMAFINERAQFIQTLRNYRGEDNGDYIRWQGHAEARRVLAESMGVELDKETGGIRKATEVVIGPDTLCPCGKVNDGSGSGYCSYECATKYDGWACDEH
jgi:hypothetical protein